MPPYKTPTIYNNLYECMEAGYKESLNKLQKIGKEEVNKHEIYIRFICQENQIIEPGVGT